MSSITARDIIAFIMVSGLILFKLTGHNGALDTPVALILGYYFAKRDDQPVVVKKEELPLT